jgi:hypothetical protein
MATRPVVAGLIVAAAAVLASPLAANAQTYVPTDSCSITPSAVVAGGTATFSAFAGTFGASQNVAFSITGHDSSNAILSSGSTSGAGDPTFITAANGSSTVSIKLPSDAAGNYQVTGVASNGDLSQCTLTVLDSADPATLTDPSDPSDPGALAHTGQVVYTSIGWVGGGIVLAGVGLLVARRFGRRRVNSGR